MQQTRETGAEPRSSDSWRAHLVIKQVAPPHGPGAQGAPVTGELNWTVGWVSAGGGGTSAGGQWAVMVEQLLAAPLLPRRSWEVSLGKKSHFNFPVIKVF